MSKLIVELPETLHTRLKRQAAEEQKTLKVIVTSLLSDYLAHPRAKASKASATHLCGAWKDTRSAETLIKDLRASRNFDLRARE